MYFSIQDSVSHGITSMSIVYAFVMRLISGLFWLVFGWLIAIPDADRIDGVPETESI